MIYWLAILPEAAELTKMFSSLPFSTISCLFLGVKTSFFPLSLLAAALEGCFEAGIPLTYTGLRLHIAKEGLEFQFQQGNWRSGILRTWAADTGHGERVCGWLVGMLSLESEREVVRKDMTFSKTKQKNNRNQFRISFYHQICGTVCV